MTRQAFVKCWLAALSIAMAATSASAQDPVGGAHAPAHATAAAAPVARLPNGKPDFSGVWLVPDIQILGWNIGKDLETGRPPNRPWVSRLVRERRERDLIDDPSSMCYPTGLFGLHLFSPFRVSMLDDRVIVLFEQTTTFRQIFLDGRTLSDEVDPSYMGYSNGRWEGDTLVVETTGFNGNSWIDSDGHPVTPNLRLTERFRRTSPSRLEIEMTFDDPTAYTRPWTVTVPFDLIPNSEVSESFCDANAFDEQLVETGLEPIPVEAQEAPVGEDEAAAAAKLAEEDAAIWARAVEMIRGLPTSKTAYGLKLVLDDRMFDAAGDLRPSAKPILDRLGAMLAELRQVRAYIVSHSDGSGNDAAMLRRAHGVRQAFIDRGAAILQAVAYQDRGHQPAASHAGASGGKANRGVEISIGLN